MTCQFIVGKKLLYEYIEGVLTDDRAEELEAHLETCPACREEEIRLASLSVMPIGRPHELLAVRAEHREAVE